ncbi:MAG: hypothetical protein WD557_12855 [Dehalococcoidia bacterium]
MATSSAPLLVNQRSGRVLLVAKTEEGGWTPTEIATESRWPAWRPEGRGAVRSSVIGAGDAARSSIVAEELDGTAVSIYEGPPGQATFIAPNVPHYALWSPAGDAVSYVAATERGLSLELSTLDGTLTNHHVATGVPLFHSWSSDGGRIAVHEGSRLLQFDRATLDVQEIHQNAVGFRTPQFAPDGGLIYAAPALAGGIALFRHDPDGSSHELGRFDGGLAFSIMGGEVFVAVTHRADASTFHSLWRVALDGAGREPVARGPLAGFWVSPAGAILVTVVPAQSGDGMVALNACTPAGELAGVTEPFLASDDLRVAMTFFDQYSLSHSPWSPDGGRLVVCGRVRADGTSASFGDPVGDYVMTWQPARGEPFEQVVPGSLASFPPKSRPEDESQ